MPLVSFNTVLSYDLHAEFDAMTGSKISSINIGSPVVRMSYSPTSGHAVVAILEVGHIFFLPLTVFLQVAYFML